MSLCETASLKSCLTYPSIYSIVTCVTLWDNLPQNLFYFTLLYTIYFLASLYDTASLKSCLTLPFYKLHCYLRHFVRQSPSKLVLLYSPIYHLLPCVTLWHSLPQKLFNFSLLYTPLLLASLCDTISLNTCFTLPSYIPTTSLRHFVTQISLKTCFYLTASSICVILCICRPQAGR